MTPHQVQVEPSTSGIRTRMSDAPIDRAFVSHVAEYLQRRRKTNEKNLAWVDSVGTYSEPHGSIILLTASPLSRIHATIAA